MFFRSLRSLAAAVILASSIALPAQNLSPSSHERIQQVLRSLDRAHYVGEVAVSPDGKRLAWIQGVRAGSEIRLAPLGDLAKFVRITASTASSGSCKEGGIAWAPDSSALAFVSDCASADGQAEIFLSTLGDPSRPAAGPARKLVQLKGDVSTPVFSPDGKSIAFLYVEAATRPVGALAAFNQPSGVIGEDGVDIQRIAKVNLPSDWKNSPGAQPAPTRPLASSLSFISPTNLHVYEFDWSPDSQSVAYIAADPPGENNWWVAKLYTQSLSATNPALVLDPATTQGGMQMAVPRWSPDGKAIAFIGGLMSDQGATGGDVWIVPASGGSPVNLTAGRKATPAWIAWDGSSALFASEIAGGGSRLVRLALLGDPASPTVSAASIGTVFDVPGTVGAGGPDLGLSITSDHSLIVFGSSTFDSPPDLYSAHAESGPSTTALWRIAQLTHINDGIQPAWGKTVSVDWTSDGFRVQGWLIFPRDYDPAKRYPLLVHVHGGPASSVVGLWQGGAGGFTSTAFSALGYFVLLPNPRGSYGQGEAFTLANRKDFGYGDLRDILAGVDSVLNAYPVDPGRVGLMGWSYGGFMTMFAVTQTHRFKAAVAGAGISDWLSYYGENSIDQWMIPYFGASVYDDPAVYQKSSAITYIKQAATPTLIVVGDRDGECPAPQSFEFWHALRNRHVPTQLVVYPNEGHGFVATAHKRAVLERAAGWFAQYMPPTPNQ